MPNSPSLPGRGQGWVARSAQNAPHKPDNHQRARTLRTTRRPEERKLWSLISRYRPKFTRQLPIGPYIALPIGPYIADFACRQARLVVEIDGGQHAESQRDATRDEWLRNEGWTVVRVWNSDVRENPIGTANRS